MLFADSLVYSLSVTATVARDLLSSCASAKRQNMLIDCRLDMIKHRHECCGKKINGHITQKLSILFRWWSIIHEMQGWQFRLCPANSVSGSAVVGVVLHY